MARIGGESSPLRAVVQGPFVMPDSVPGLWVRTGGEGTDSIPFAFEPLLPHETSFVIRARAR